MTAVAKALNQTELWGQPRRLWVLAGTELWDRISFHGMQALLVLYMADALLLPGHVEHVIGFAGFRVVVEQVTGRLSVEALAAQTFGLYVGLVYFTPVIGGAIGDRLTGRRIAVTLGALLMIAGHFALAFDASFLLALLLLICGAGLLRGNLSAQVKSLYADGDRREVDAFQLYYVAINLGAFVAPVVTGALAKYEGWHAGFGFAGFGMMIGLIVYIVGQRHLPADTKREAAIASAPLTVAERGRVAGLAMFWPLQMCFWIAQSQVWNVYNLWVRDHVNLRVAGFDTPVAWLQALDGLAPILVMPLVLAWWRRQAAKGREPDDLAKLAIGCAILALGVVWLAAAPVVSGSDGRAPLPWAVAFHLIANTGWLYFAPVSLALYATRAPTRYRGTLIGVSYLATFAASVTSGRIGGLYETVSPTAFWLIHAVIVGGAGLGIMLLLRPLRRRLGGSPDAAIV
jgi:POT family proton-dependent oligopeptide transporter